MEWPWQLCLSYICCATAAVKFSNQTHHYFRKAFQCAVRKAQTPNLKRCEPCCRLLWRVFGAGSAGALGGHCIHMGVFRDKSSRLLPLNVVDVLVSVYGGTDPSTPPSTLAAVAPGLPHSQPLPEHVRHQHPTSWSCSTHRSFCFLALFMAFLRPFSAPLPTPCSPAPMPWPLLTGLQGLQHSGTLLTCMHGGGPLVPDVIPA